MKEGAVPAIVHAAAISYGFVFMHPFEDGNGRIHRFLIHNILFLRGEVPRGLVFPVSAVMLKNPILYAQSLEAFSVPLMQLVEYKLDDRGMMTVLGETGYLYKYIDMTAQAEALYDFVKRTIEDELAKELYFWRTTTGQSRLFKKLRTCLTVLSISLSNFVCKTMAVFRREKGNLTLCF